MNELKDINYTERRDSLLRRRELSKAKRLQSMRNRLKVDMGGFITHYTDI